MNFRKLTRLNFKTIFVNFYFLEKRNRACLIFFFPFVPMAGAYLFITSFQTVKSYIRPESTILVHGGSGAFGQAVLSIALAYGCKVFTTVSDTHKKRFLLKLFPQLKGSVMF